jgi:hypothetical protein
MRAPMQKEVPESAAWDLPIDGVGHARFNNVEQMKYGDHHF